MHPVFIQAFYYGILMVITIAFMGVILKGFLFKYLKVRLSFGKYVLVKIRSALRDYYQVGWVEDGFLCFKNAKRTIRLAISNDDKLFYRSLAVNWIDVDENKNAIAKTDYSAISGYDAKKYSDLYTRALERPQVSSSQEKIIIVLCIVIALISIAAAILSYNNMVKVEELSRNLPQMISGLKGTITGGGSI